MPIVTVQQSPRVVAQKRQLAAGITQAFVAAYGVTADQVQVFFQEAGPADWAKSGVLALDRES